MPTKKTLTAKHSSDGEPPRQPLDTRRLMALIVAIVMLIASLIAWWTSDSSSGQFVAAASGRIGLVMMALWIAWPSLKRPAKWLPAGAPVIGIVALLAVCVQPRLIIPAIPIVGGLITLSAFVRAFRRPTRR